MDNGIGASIFIITIPVAVPNLKLAVGSKKMMKLLKEVEKGNLKGKWTKKLIQKIGGNRNAHVVHHMVRDLNYVGEGGLCTVRYNAWEGFDTWHV